MAEVQKPPFSSNVKLMETSGEPSPEVSSHRWQNDEELMRHVATGDREAIENLIKRFQPGIRNLIGRLTAWSADVDDITQEVFLKAWQRAHQFNRQSSLQNWLYTIAVNQCRNHRRGLSRWWKMLEGFFEQKRTEGLPNSIETITTNEAWLEVQNALTQLRQPDRELLVLTYTEEKTTAEIVQILAITENNYYVRLHRAKERLTQQLESNRSQVKK
jgi:RNA polymerase sigma-70 factor (ECF subfamily)